MRSSGVDEDLPGASYAGLYETVLNVPAEDVPAAVRHCWASAFSHRVEAYRQSKGSAGQVAMAVLILPMVQADAAGVAFSADPISGDRGTASMLSAASASAWAPGIASPDEWVVRGGEASVRAAPEGAIDAAMATGWPNSLGGWSVTAARRKTSSGLWPATTSSCCRRGRSLACLTSRSSQCRFR